MINFKSKPLPEVNIGTVGHVDHGKTSLVHCLTGKWADTHSEELKRGITIRIGYADSTFYKCKKCSAYGTSEKCQACFGDAEAARTVSFVDLPGHETLMATVLSGSSLLSGALLVIAANEKCPQPQTAEHMKVLDVAGIRNIVIVQTKVDIVDEDRAVKSYEEIKEFVKGTVAENAPIIPVSSIHCTNMDALIGAIEKHIPTSKQDDKTQKRFLIARSFDINKPGTEIKNLTGGVIGGSIISGVVRVNDEIEIMPGVNMNDKWAPLKTKILGIVQSGQDVKESQKGGLVALQTDLDPSITRGDGLAGNMAGKELPPAADEIKIETDLFDHVIGIEGFQKVEPIRTNDVLMITVSIAKTVGRVASARGNVAQLKLKIPVCAEKGSRVSLSKQIQGRWHLIGWGKLL